MSYKKFMYYLTIFLGVLLSILLIVKQDNSYLTPILLCWLLADGIYGKEYGRI